MENKETQKRTINIINILVAAVLLIGIVWIASTFIHIGVEYTNNAQVRQHITPLNSRVQGFIKEIRFNEFQPVKKGDTLVIIEDIEYRLRVAQAEADLEKALQNRNAAGTSATTARNNISVSDATLEEVKILLDNTRKEYERHEKLFASGAITEQQYDGAKTHYNAMQAKYNTLQKQRKSTSLVSDELATRHEQQNAFVKLAETALELARINLSYTIITAPADGVMGRKAIQEGQLIQPGQAVANIVESGSKWVIANYKETQTTDICEGQSVDIEVDAVPGVTYKGVVRSISYATGAAYSLVPTDNSAGNFVKVEQRIPVRIEFTEENSADDLARLRSGMNAECKIIY